LYSERPIKLCNARFEDGRLILENNETKLVFILQKFQVAEQEFMIPHIYDATLKVDWCECLL